MIKILFLLLITSLFTFAECSDSINGKIPLRIIDIGSNINNYKELELSQFANNIQYIPLDSSMDFAITGTIDCAFSDSLLIAKDLKNCFLFANKGQFLRKIGNRGRGPAEYQYAMNTVFGNDGKIYIQSMYDLYEYNTDGSFFGKYKNIFVFNDDDYTASWDFINDSMIFAKVASSTGREKYKAVILNKKGDKGIYYTNYIHFNRKKHLSAEDEEHANIFKFQNKLFYKEVYNDTLFSLTSRYQLLPEFVITLGKYSRPISAREDVSSESLRKLGDYMRVDNVYMTNKFLLIDCFFSYRFPVKRLTPKVVVSGLPPMIYNTRSVLGIYDILSGELNFCKPTSTDNPLFTSGIYNDIDAGPRFFPNKQVNDSTFVMWISAKALIDHVASEAFLNNIPKYPEKKKQLKAFANTLSELDNPVLMFVTFRNN